ncbi:MAG: c-type cytochrome domain-containing protein, partial [Limisphaerales bacterium]
MYPGSKPLNILRHHKHTCLVWSLVCVICFHVSILGGEASSESSLTYERDIRPIFKAMCFHCHGEDDHREGGLDLRLVRLMKVGGDEGPAIVPGSADTSLLWQRISEDEMPEGETKLTPAEKSAIHDWINAGAVTARPEPDNVEDARFTEEEVNHWSFKKLAHQPVPERV